MFQSLFGSLLNYRYGNENVSLRHLSWICITSILTTIYSLKNCSVYGRSCRIYSPKSFGFFRKEFRQVSKKNVIYRLRVGPYGEKLWPRSWKCCPTAYGLRTIQCFLLKSSNAFNHLMHSMMFPGYIVSPSFSNWGLRFVVLPASNHKTKTAAKTLYLTLKQWNRWGLRFLVLPAPNYKTETLTKNAILDPKTLKSVGSSFFSFTSYW